MAASPTDPINLGEKADAERLGETAQAVDRTRN